MPSFVLQNRVWEMQSRPTTSVYSEEMSPLPPSTEIDDLPVVTQL